MAVNMIGKLQFLSFISGMAEARAVRFGTKRHYIKSCHRDDKSPLKGMWFCSHTHFCMCKCGPKKIIHGTPLTAISKVVDDGLLLIAPTVLEATLRLRPKLHRFAQGRRKHSHIIEHI